MYSDVQQCISRRLTDISLNTYCFLSTFKLLIIGFAHHTLPKSISPLEGKKLNVTFPEATQCLLFPKNGGEQHKRHHRKKSGSLQAEGETPFYTAHGRQHKHEPRKRMGHWTCLQSSLKLTQASWNCNNYSNLKQCYWKTTPWGLCIFPPFASCILQDSARCLPTSLTIFPEELELKKRLIQGTLDYYGSLVITVSILAIKYERWGNFPSRHSCHQDYFYVLKRLWIKCYTGRWSRRDIPENSKD